MLKKKMLIALGVAAVLSVSCVSVTVWAEENAEEQTEEAEDSSNSEGEEDADLEESDNSLRKESKVVQTKKQYGDFSLTALSFASISIFSG